MRRLLSCLLVLGLTSCPDKAEEEEDDADIGGAGFGDGGGTDQGDGGGSGDAGDDGGDDDGGDDGGDGGGDYDPPDDGGDDGGGDGGASGDDEDGDGWTTGDGDCDDDDPRVHPGVSEDDCDGTDSDCDGDIDEDFDGDDMEPDGEDLGEIENTETVTGYISPEDDADDIYFYVEDGWLDYFGFDIELDPPSRVDGGMELYWLPDSGDAWQQVDSVDDEGAGDIELIEYQGSGGTSDSGWYGVVVYSSDGASCDQRYTVTITP